VSGGETLSFEGASARNCVSRKVLLTTGLANMPRSELGHKNGRRASWPARRNLLR